jgi:hypothetical protein
MLTRSADVGSGWAACTRACPYPSMAGVQLVLSGRELCHGFWLTTWSVSGVASHSIAVLHQIYAKVIAGLESAAHERIERALGWES